MQIHACEVCIHVSLGLRATLPVRGRHHSVARTDLPTLVGSRSQQHKGPSTIRRRGRGAPRTCPSGRGTPWGLSSLEGSRSPCDTNRHTLRCAAWCHCRSVLPGNRAVAQQHSTCRQRTPSASAWFSCGNRCCAEHRPAEAARGYWYQRLRRSRNTLHAPCAACENPPGRTTRRCHHTDAVACSLRPQGSRSPDRKSPSRMPT